MKKILRFLLFLSPSAWALSFGILMYLGENSDLSKLEHELPFVIALVFSSTVIFIFLALIQFLSDIMRKIVIVLEICFNLGLLSIVSFITLFATVFKADVPGSHFFDSTLFIILGILGLITAMTILGCYLLIRQWDPRKKQIAGN